MLLVTQNTLGLCDLVIHWKYKAQKWPVKMRFMWKWSLIVCWCFMILGHLAAVHRCKRSCFQEHQDYCRVSCWWAHQCCQGEIGNPIGAFYCVHVQSMYSKLTYESFPFLLNFDCYCKVLFLFVLQGSSNSYAIKKKDELERVAKSNR